jgi:hypothetical protein
VRASLAVAVLALTGCPYDGRELDPDAPPGTPDAAAGTPDAAAGTPDAIPDDDLDDDGVPNAADNCPSFPNPLQHDHDIDTRGDPCDLCPHIFTAVDVDGDIDGIGDECDPRAGVDSFVAFYGFYDAGEITGWGPNTDWAVAGGVLSRTGIAGTSSFGPTASVHNPYVASHAVVNTIGASSSYSAGVSVAVNPSAQHFYSCYRSRGTNMGNPYVIDTYLGAWTGDSDYSFTLASSLVSGTQLDLVDGIDSSGGHCVVNGWTYDGTKHGPTDGTVVAWTDDLTASYDYLFVVSVGD